MIPTTITFAGRSPYYLNTFVYDVWNYENLSQIYVEGIEDGIVLLDCSEGSDIREFLQFVEGIFHPDSNFALYVCTDLKIPKEDIRGVKFNFNKVDFLVTKENANANTLYEYFKKEFKKIRKSW